MKLSTRLTETYLDYCNNYLTVEKFAEDYGISQDQALALIAIGKEIHERDVAASNLTEN